MRKRRPSLYWVLVEQRRRRDSLPIMVDAQSAGAHAGGYLFAALRDPREEISPEEAARTTRMMLDVVRRHRRRGNWEGEADGW